MVLYPGMDFLGALFKKERATPSPPPPPPRRQLFRGKNFPDEYVAIAFQWLYPTINLLHYCKVLLDYSIWIVIVVHSSLIIMLLLKLLNLILSLIIFCFIMKNSTPPCIPLTRARGGAHPPSKSIPGYITISDLLQGMLINVFLTLVLDSSGFNISFYFFSLGWFI
jgi:hypothetical protein